MKSCFIRITLIVLAALSVSSASRPLAAHRERARDIVANMTLAEKIAMVHGVPGPYVGNVPANTRLNIPALTLEDGPQGVADGVTGVTCWPSALTMVATWDPELMQTFAAAMAYEEKMKGTNIQLAPMVNIARVPVGGRNFESMGEDPVLAGRMVAANIQGIQSQGIMATVKHFVDNNQEYHRTTVSENVPQRAQWEIYYPAFQAAVDAGVVAVMCSYNLINNTYACENAQTLYDLKERMGFDGFVMSDWGATHSTVKAALAGLDQQMPDDNFFGANLMAAVQNGSVPQSRVDDMVTRILTAMSAVGILDRAPVGNITANVESAAHNALAQQLSTAAHILLQNYPPTSGSSEPLLPLDLDKITTIAVIGDDGNDDPIVAGDGSGHVIAPFVVTPLQGIQSRAGSNVKVIYAPTSPLSAAVAAAAAADIAIVFVANKSSEGIDRPTLSMGDTQDALVSGVASVQPNTVAVVHAPGAVLMPWAASVPAIVCGLMPGQADGAAVAAVLFGDANPSARLPVTFPISDSQTCVDTPQQYPGINDQANYTEGLLVGYRWYDAKKQTPLFPFGHGLSYTTFEYSNLIVQHIGSMQWNVTVTVNNTGSRAGREVVQVYLAYPSVYNEPPKVLRDFAGVVLNPGQSVDVTFSLSQQSVSYWDVTRNDWSVGHGSFQVLVGASSRDIRQTAFFTA